MVLLCDHRALESWFQTQGVPRTQERDVLLTTLCGRRLLVQFFPHLILQLGSVTSNSARKLGAETFWHADSSRVV